MGNMDDLRERIGAGRVAARARTVRDMESLPESARATAERVIRDVSIGKITAAEGMAQLDAALQVAGRQAARIVADEHRTQGTLFGTDRLL